MTRHEPPNGPPGSNAIPPAPDRPRPAGPEILAPAGDDDCLTAALNAGADAVYFGLSEGFNARARARNFTLAGLPATVRRIHERGARAYVTLNTLVFDSELPRLESIIRAVARAGVDAILIQDPAVALLAREICPQVDRHASTQMTLSSGEGMALAAELGLTRVVLPRELSIEEVGRLRGETDLELEVFIHGALCVSWSGQCLTSEAWGGRSANRGQCAQSCRLPYELVVDGRTRELGEVAYLLSPRDLAGWRHLPELLALGVASVKIEGRQKGAAYVATAVEAYRTARDRAVARSRELLDPGQADAMAVSFSRGLGPGFLEGVDHQRLVDGRFPKHRGLYVGTVERVDPPAVIVRLDRQGHRPAPGDGLVFDAGHPERDEPGGPLFDVRPIGHDRLELRFGRPGPDLHEVSTGQRVWKTADARVSRHVQKLLRDEAPRATHSVTMTCRGQAGGPLIIEALGPDGPVAAESAGRLAPARSAGLGADILRDKLGRLGGTRWSLAALDLSELEAGLHLPVSELNELRRRLVRQLDERFDRRLAMPGFVAAEGAVDRILAQLPADTAPGPAGVQVAAPPRLVPLCRTDAQLGAVIALGFDEVELDWMEMVGLERAVERARAAGLRVTVATVRVQKPGEEGYDRRIARLEPDGLLVRHWGALEFFRRHPEERRPRLHGDFSLNATNAITARFLLGRGLDDLTPAHDMDLAQLQRLLERVDPGRITVPLHHHMTTFHTEHCVYAHLMSDGKDYRDCGRPCEAHQVSLRDRIGEEHPVVVDVGCRNTVFNARAQTAAPHLADLAARGVRRFRIEFVRETAEEAATVLEVSRDLLAGRLTAAEAVRRVGALEKFGVTSGTLQTLV